MTLGLDSTTEMPFKNAFRNMSRGLVPSSNHSSLCLKGYSPSIIQFGVVNFSDLVTMQNKSSFTNSSCSSSQTWVYLIFPFTQVKSELQALKFSFSPLYLSSLSSNIYISLKVLFFSSCSSPFLNFISFLPLLLLHQQD